MMLVWASSHVEVVVHAGAVVFVFKYLYPVHRVGLLEGFQKAGFRVPPCASCRVSGRLSRCLLGFPWSLAADIWLLCWVDPP